MTTATASKAPTEAEIRAAVQEALDSSSIDIGEWVNDMVLPLSYIAPDERGAPEPVECLWDDLRASESERLANLVEGVYIRVQPLEAEITAKIREAIVEAALTFAAEYPDAPRAVQEPSGARTITAHVTPHPDSAERTITARVEPR